MKTVWVLTSEHNDYDQHGEYFEAAFAQKPTIKQLAEYLGYNKPNITYNVMEAVALLEHIRDGGGRRDNEQHWYNLKEVTLL